MNNNAAAATLGGYGSINAFVEAKLNQYDASARDFGALFALMFAEKDNIMFEESRGYRIVQTTYGQAKDAILRRAASLRTQLSDCAHNDVVGIYMDNSLDWIEIFWAVLACGFCPLLMNLRLSEETLAYALRVSGAKAVISDEKRFALRTILADEVVLSQRPLQDGSFGSDVLVMSSGTSSHVKICAYSAEEFYYQIRGSYSIIRSCAQVKKHHEGQLKQLTFLPFYHIFGLVAVYIWFAFFSRTMVMLGDMSPQTIINTIKRHKVTHIFAVPLFWEKVYEQAMRTIREQGDDTVKKFEKGMRISRKIADVPLLGAWFTRVAFREVREKMFGDSIRFMITGGSCISEEVLTFFNAIGYRLADGYGMSEIGITSVELSDKHKILNAGFVGKPMAGVEYKIDDNGELLVRGKAMARYVIEDGMRHDNSGWFPTHDLAVCENGRYKILGRRDDLIVAANGENLNPNLVEAELAVEGVLGVCLVGARQDGATVPTLLVSVNRYISGERLQSVEQALRQKLADKHLSGQISRICFTATPLMTENEFKLNRTRLAQALESGALESIVPDRATQGREDDDIARFIIRLFAVALQKPENEIGYTTDFFLDEGGTSLDYFAIIAQLRDEYHVPFPSGDTALSSVKGLHDYIIGRMQDAD